MSWLPLVARRAAGPRAGPGRRGRRVTSRYGGAAVMAGHSSRERRPPLGVLLSSLPSGAVSVLCVSLSLCISSPLLAPLLYIQGRSLLAALSDKPSVVSRRRLCCRGRHGLPVGASVISFVSRLVIGLHSGVGAVGRPALFPVPPSLSSRQGRCSPSPPSLMRTAPLL